MIRWLLLLAAALPLAGQSAWLPAPGKAVATGVFTTQSYRDMWAPRRRVTLPGRVGQHTGAAALELGLTRRLAVDVSMGGTGVRTSAFGGVRSADSGLMDSAFGLRVGISEDRGGWRGRPAAAIRVGAIVRGTYRPARSYSAGDGASGLEVSVAGGKALAESAGVYGEVGYRNRNRGVPSDQFFSAGAYRRLGWLVVGGAYRSVRGLSGQNMRDPGFTFPRLREDNQFLEPSVSFGKPGRGQYQIFAAKSVGGRNTGDKIVLGIAVSFGFRMPWARGRA